MRGTLQIAFIALQIKLMQSSLLTDYEQCREMGFGDDLLLCDTDNILLNETHEKLSALLTKLQMNVKCNCSSGCERPNGNDGYIGLLLVTNSSKIVETGMELNETSKKIYKDVQLGNDECDNGILIIYIKDKQQLSTFHGAGSFILLRTDDIMRLHDAAMRVSSNEDDDALALQYLLKNYGDARKLQIQRAETWMPLLGLILALVLVLLISLLLLALFLARFCCCCARRKKDDEEMYALSSGQRSSKFMEPVMVATPQSERIFNASDAIYSTPYSGTPIPPPHLHGLHPELYPGSIRSSSMSVTPTPTQRNRIRPIHAPIQRGFSSAGTPSSRNRISKVDDATQTTNSLNGNDILRNNDSELQADAETGTTAASSPLKAASETIKPIVFNRPDSYDEAELSFLDPRRKLEVQTRTDYIY